MMTLASAAATSPATSAAAATKTLTRIKLPATDAVNQWLALQRRFVALRKSDRSKLRPPSAVPRTTVADIVQLTAEWNKFVRKVGLSGTERDRWSACVRAVAQAADTLQPGDVYPQNDRWWTVCTKRLANELNQEQTDPWEISIVVESVVESAKELPDRLEKAGAAAVEVAKAPFEGARKALGLPDGSDLLLIAGAAAAGYFLLRR